MALFRDYGALILLRFIAGFATGCVFIAGFSLAARAGAASGRSSLFTIIYGSGAGIGMVLSGLLLPPVLTPRWNWPGSWIVLGLLTLISIALAIPAVRRVHPMTAGAAQGASVSLGRLRPIRGLFPLWRWLLCADDVCNCLSPRRGLRTGAHRGLLDRGGTGRQCFDGSVGTTAWPDAWQRRGSPDDGSTDFKRTGPSAAEWYCCSHALGGLVLCIALASLQRGSVAK